MNKKKVYVESMQQAPHVVCVYNKFMGAVDLIGFFMAILRYNFRQTRWTTTVILALFSIAVSNAHKLYIMATGKRLALSEFVQNLLLELETLIERVSAKVDISDISRGRKKKAWAMRRKSFEKDKTRIIIDKGHIYLIFRRVVQIITVYGWGAQEEPKLGVTNVGFPCASRERTILRKSRLRIHVGMMFILIRK